MNREKIKIIQLLSIYFLITLSTITIDGEKIYAYQSNPQSLMSLSLEELMDIKIDSLMKIDNSYFNTPSAVYVITSEDIRRSGMSTIPELLRMVPGINMGRLDGNTWAINIRGPAYIFSNNLLVMIDGRTLYSPLANSVNWDAVDTMIPDIERIEVLRGPGSSLWGTNSASGVINIVTKKPSDTKGFLIWGETGEGDIKNQYGLRYGLSNRDFAIRFYAKKRDLDNHHYPTIREQNQRTTKYNFKPLSESPDSGTLTTAGFKSGFQISNKSNITLQGDIYSGEFINVRNLTSNYALNTNDTSGYNLMFKWDYKFSDNYNLKLQSYIDNTKRENSIFHDNRTLYDIDFQNTILIPKNRLTLGAGYRYIRNETDHFNNKFGFALDPPKRNDDLITYFFHDEFFIIKDLITLSGGIKFENNDYTGFEYQPNIKLAFTPDDSQIFWISYSEPVAIPSRSTSDAYLDLSGYPSNMCRMLGGKKHPRLGCILDVSAKKLESSRINAIEAGYRKRISDKIFFDLALFHHKYKRKTLQILDIDYLTGIEGNIRYNPLENWKLELTYYYHEGKGISPQIFKDDTYDIPQHNFKLRSLLNLYPKIEWDTLIFYRSKIRDYDRKKVLVERPPYVRFDMRIGYRISDNLDISLIGQNLFDNHHLENTDDPQKAQTTVDRSYLVRLLWNF